MEGIFQRPIEGMAEALLVKDEQAFARDPQVGALGLVGRDFFPLEVAAVDQVMNRLPRDGEELGHFSNLEERRDRFLFN